MDLFFLLSGFILAHVYGPQVQKASLLTYFEFIGNRFARIYPAYLVALLALIGMVCVSILAHIPRSVEMYPLSTLPFEFLMVQAWGPLLLSWNYPAWSVSAEWFAYLFIFPVGYWMLHRIHKSPALLFLATMGFCSLLAALSPAGGLPHSLVRVTCEFLAGITLFGMRWHLLKFPDRASMILGFALVVLLGTFLIPRISSTATWFLITMSLGSIILSISIPGTCASNALSWAPFVYAGRISYSLYLTHALSQRILKVLLPAAHFSDAPSSVRYLVLLVSIAVIIVPATILFHMVEEPARHYLRDFFAKIPGKTKTLFQPGEL